MTNIHFVAESAANNDETHTQLGPVLLEEICIDVLKFQGSEATLVSKDKNSGQTSEGSDNSESCILWRLCQLSLPAPLRYIPLFFLGEVLC